MMADALRALRVLPPFYQALSVHLVEINPVLREKQQATLSGVRNIAWHDSIDDVPDGPAIIFANEYFDVLPIHQVVGARPAGTSAPIELDADGKLVFGAAAEPTPRFEVLLPPLVRAAPVGAVFEWRPDTEMMKIASRVRDQDGAALIIDYGHVRSDAGDTFQAIARHSFTDPLKAPGQADVTAHVDFQALARAAEDVGARVHGPVTQGEFLRRLGIETRAVTLMAKATPRGFRGHFLRAEAADRRRPRRHGRAVQGARASPNLDLAGAGGLRATANEQADDAMILASPLLSAIPGLRHAFFTRDGGVSGGIYASLNGGLGSNDDPGHVAENRAPHGGSGSASRLSTCSACTRSIRPMSVVADRPLGRPRRGRSADAIVTQTPKARASASPPPIAGRCCSSIPNARVIGAAHAGWKGALTGVLESTVEAMEKLGAERGGIVAAIGPLIRQQTYEVGDEFVERFIEADAENARVLPALARAGHAMFDLAGFIRMRLENAGVLMIDDLGVDTYSDERFFSYRRSVHRKEPDYGRHVHAIALARE